MDSSHKNSVLITSCLKTPVNPQTKAPTALYERERAARLSPIEEQQRGQRDNRDLEEDEAWTGHRDEKDDSECESEESNSENEKEQGFKHIKNKEPEDILDVHEMYHSNEEYYKRLEELKNTHIETMKKLEQMYQNKLHLKGVQPTDNDCDISDPYCRSKWHQPAGLCKPLSGFDLNNTAHSSVSDGSDEAVIDTETETSTDTGSLSSPRDHIDKMWNGFSIEDYDHARQCRWLSSSHMKKIKKKTKEWSPKITVPEPFHMTIREAEKQKKKVKSRSEVELENYMLKKQMEEEAECQKKFRANPVPASVYFPLYDEIMARNEERRRFVTERSKEILLSTQKPFNFIEREEKKKELRKMQLKDLAPPKKKKTKFKAKPVPRFIYGPTVSDRIKEQELYRGIRMHMRAQELLHSSSFPRSMLSSSAPPGCRKHRRANVNEEVTFKPSVNSEVPDFEVLHRKSRKQLMRKKHLKQMTVCEPFALHTSQIQSNKDKILKDIQADEDNLKETRWPYRSCRHPPKPQCSSSNSSLSGSLESVLIRGTDSAKKRQEAIKKQDRQRTKEYLKELEEMQDRVNRRPLLLQQVTQHNAKRAAEKHYSDTLREVGLSDEFVLSKGRTAKKLHYHFSDTDSDNNSEDAERPAEDGEPRVESCEYQDDYENLDENESPDEEEENCPVEKQSDEESLKSGTEISPGSLNT